MEYKLSKTIFCKEAILKNVYLWQEEFPIRICEDDHNWLVSIEKNEQDKTFDFEKFQRELLEQQLRENLNKQFGTLRNCIYNKAFQHFKD